MNIVPFFEGNSARTFGGAEAQTAFLADMFQKLGHDVVMVVTDLTDSARLPCPAENAYRSSGGIPGFRFFHPRWSGTMKALERVDADLYYQRNAGMITGLTAKFCRSRGKVFVYGAGSDVDFSIRDVSIRNWRDRMLHSYGLHRSHGIVVQNEQQQAAANVHFNQPVRVIANGVHPIETRTNEQGENIVWVGALWAVKRPEVVIEIAKQIPEKRFVVIGGEMSGERHLAESIRRSARSLPNVELTGRLSRADVQKELRRAALLINTSRVEGFPNAYLEAWNHGVPVVTFNDIDGTIAETGTGVVCRSNQEMIEAIRSLHGDTERIREMGDRARRLVKDRFAPEVLGCQYESFFEMLLERSAVDAAQKGAPR
ncbi:MAG: glycosyltransferase family 4 protein [Candidatus Krumholzibacteriota bacterium]|nr:glycosyltransferase family 4 protein [Candidatus Krumholzibacteriota bacterium]